MRESGAFWVGVMITENKKATEVRPLLRPASNYTHRHKNIHGGFQSGHQAAAEVSHGHHVCWPMVSRLINKQSGLEGQIRVGVGQGNASRVGVKMEGSLADDDCKVSMQCMVQYATIFTYRKKEKKLGGTFSV